LEFTENNINLYPDHFGSSIIIYLTSGELFHHNDLIILHIKNLNGQIIKSFHVDLNYYSSLHEIDLAWNGRDVKGKKINKGIYLLELWDGENMIESKKIIMLK